MNCPKCNRQLGCSCQLRKDPTSQAVIGCSGCLQGKNVANVAVNPPNKSRVSATMYERGAIPKVNPPIVNRAYWTRKQPNLN